MRSLVILFLTLPLSCYGQRWIEQEISRTLSVPLPENSLTIDTLGQHIISANYQDAFILVQTIANEGDHAFNVSSEEDLETMYDRFPSRFVDAQHGTLIKKKLADVQGMKALTFSYYLRADQEERIAYTTTVFVNDTTYTFTMTVPRPMAIQYGQIRKNFVEAIRLNNSVISVSQLSSAGTRKYYMNLGVRIGRNILIGVLSLIIVSGLVWLSMRKRGRSSNQRRV